MIKRRMKEAQDRQESSTDNRRDLKFKVEDFVFVKVVPTRGVVRFEGAGKLTPTYIGPFKVIERIGLLAYTVELPERFNFKLKMMSKFDFTCNFFNRYLFPLLWL